MEKNLDEVKRNMPSDKGAQDDPQVRDESATQPGSSTISSSKSDEANQRITKTAADGFKSAHGEDADASFDDIGEADDNK